MNEGAVICGYFFAIGRFTCTFIQSLTRKPKIRKYNKVAAVMRMGKAVKPGMPMVRIMIEKRTSAMTAKSKTLPMGC